MFKAAFKTASIALLSSVAISTWANGLSNTDSYPNRPVRLVVAFAPGGATDILARIVATQLTKALGQPFVVENRAGGGGVIAVDTVMNAPADGYTVLVGGSGPLVFNHISGEKVRYRPEDLTPITVLGSYPIVIAAKKGLKAQDFASVVKLAKENPGKLSFGHPSASFQVPFDYLSSKLGVKLLAVPYKGAGPAAQGLISGDTDLLVSDTATIAPMHNTGLATAVAVTTKRRNTALPNVPSIAELGLTDFEASAFAALAAHKATPPEIIEKLHRSVANALKDPSVLKRLDEMGIEAGGDSPADTAKRINREIAAYRPIAEATQNKEAK